MEKVSTNKKRNKSNQAFIILIVLLAVLLIFVLSMFWGRYKIEALDLLGIFMVSPAEWLDRPETSVFFYIRLPRIILALLVGAALSAAGSLFQGMFRNPLVSPDILGVSAGCCFGAAVGILLPGSHPGLVQLLAFLSGIAAMLLAYGIARASRGEPVIMLILGGMVVSGFFSAALSFIKYIADPYEDLPTIVFWIMGGLYRANWDMVFNLIIAVVPCLVLLVLLSWKINILSLGDEEASALGINVRYFRLFLVSLATFIVASCVSVSGTIGWVGLIVPHIARMLVGPDHKYSIPAALLTGAGFVLLMDDLARCLTTAEIPLSILTAALGTPFFAYLLIKGRGNVWK